MKNTWNGLKQLIGQMKTILNAKQKRKAVGIFILLLFGAGFETLGVSMVVPFIMAMMTPNEIRKIDFIQNILLKLHIDTDIELVAAMGVVLISIYVIKNLYLLMTSYFRIKFQCDIQQELSVRMLSLYMKRPYTYFLDAKSGDMMRGITQDISGVYIVLDSIFKILAEASTVLVITIFIMKTDLFMATSVILLAGGCFLVVVLGLRKKLRDLGEKQRACASDKYKYASQLMYGIKDIKVMRRENLFIEKYDRAYEVQTRADRNYYFANGCPERIIEAVCICGLIASVCIRVAMGLEVATFIPKLGAFAVAAFRILPSMARITGDFNGIIYFKPAVVGVYENIMTVQEYDKEILERELLEKNEKSVVPFHDSVVVKGITWQYPDAEEPVLKDLDLEIQKGESIAFIGASGSGKTTLSDILLGLFRPQKGKILMDGIDISTIPSQWGRTIGYVQQSVFLIDDTIRNNVLFGIDEKECDDDAVWRALEKAQLKEFVESLPQKLDTMVGERGVKFSGGQRQRVAIARALYYDPPILVLDEATSALDNETETAVMESIDALQGYKTLIIVAHRLSTIRNCDKVYTIGEGKAKVTKISHET